MAEPGYAAFSVLQISTRCIVGDVDRLLRYVKADLRIKIGVLY